MKLKQHTKRAVLLAGAMLFISTAAHAAEEKKANKQPAKAQCSETKAKTEEVTFLGVYTTQVAPSLAHQMGFTKGFYLTVQQVQPGSPAAKSGLKTHDVLQKVDNQILINPEQLRELIRSKDPGHTVGLTYFRGGHEHTTSAKLVTQTVPKVVQAGGPAPRPAQAWKFAPGHPGLQDKVRKQLREHGIDLDKLQKQGNVHTFKFGLPGGKGLDEEVRKKLREQGVDLDKLLEQGQGRTFRFAVPGNEGGIITGRGGKPGPKVSASATVEMDTQLHCNINNDHGSLSLSFKDGKGDLEIKDKAGKSLYKGAYRPGQKIKGLPAHWQKHLRELDSRCDKHLKKPAPRRKNSQKKGD